MEINKQGYKVIINKQGKRVLEHRQVWEDNKGKIPPWYSIHHKDGNKLNNNIENLELLRFEEHIKEHRKHKLKSL